MQKVVLSLDVHDDKKCQRRVMKIASSVYGLDSISLDIKEKKLTIIGNMDPVEVVKKLRKVYHTVIVSIGPAKEPEKPKEKPKEAAHNQVQVFQPIHASGYPLYPQYYSYYYP